MKKNYFIYIYNFAISCFLVLSCNFFFSQYYEVTKINTTDLSNFHYFLRDNAFILILFSIFLISLLSNIYYVLEYWIYTSKTEISVKRILGYTNSNLLWQFYFKYTLMLTMAFVLSCVVIGFMHCINTLIISHIYSVFSAAFLILFTLSSMLTIVSLLFLILSMDQKTIKYNTLFSWKKIVVIFQFSLSFLLIFASLLLFNKIDDETSVYKNYANSNLTLFTLDYENKDVNETIDNRYEHNSSIQTLNNTISVLSNEYKDKIEYYFYSNIYLLDKDIRALHVSKGILNINNLDLTISSQRQSNNYAESVFLGYAFSNSYKIGDVIKSDDNREYVIEGFFNQGAKIIPPFEYSSQSLDDCFVVLVNDKNIEKYIASENINFYQSLYFSDLDETSISTIQKNINEFPLKFKIQEIADIQSQFLYQKMMAMNSYTILALTNLIFSFIGFILILLIEIRKKTIIHSIKIILGYSTEEILADSLIEIVILVLLSTLVANLLAIYTNAFTIQGFVAILILNVVMVLSSITFTFKNLKILNAVNVLGGENV